MKGPLDQREQAIARRQFLRESKNGSRFDAAERQRQGNRPVVDA
jgi:hypothetical protein